MSEQNKFENTPENHEQKRSGGFHRRPGKYNRYHGKHHQKKNEKGATEILLTEEEVTAEAIEETIEDTSAQETVLQEAEMPPEQTGEETSKEASDEEPAEAEMTEVIGVRFRSSGKIYYFDNCGAVYPLGCHAIVDTARGMEYGEVAMSNRMVCSSELVLPLRQALRIATPEDDRHYAENKQKEAEAAEIWNKKILQHNLEMKLIDIECTFDNSKILFYFTAEGRVDFRDLVKDLASVFRCRIELRQMGIRDEAKILGGLGVCGRPFCCHSFLPDFVQVSIKMAKEQNLSLNSAKISGACGRLMCCLRYEYDTYLEEAKLTPKVDSLVKTPDGIGTVVEAKPLLGLVKVQLANTPEAAPIVYSRDLVKPHKPGDPVELPAPPAPVAKEPNAKASATKKQPEAKQERRQNQEQNQNQNQNQNQRKRPADSQDKKKQADGEKEIKKQEPKPARAEKQPKPEVEKPKENKSARPAQPERKYTIQRAGEAPAEESEGSKKKDGYHHRRRHYHNKDRKEKKGSDQA